MFELAKGLGAVNIFAALPSDGHFYNEFLLRLGGEHVWEIPRQRFTVKDLSRLWRLCRQYKIDLVHSHGKGAGVYARLLGVLLGKPVVHTLHGYHDGRYGNLGKKVYALWEALASVLTCKIICVSRSEADAFKDKVLVSASKLEVIPNGTPVQPALVVARVPKKVVTVARFDYQKNLLELVDVARYMSDYAFHVIGDGDDRVAIEAHIVRCGVKNVHLHGASFNVLADISDADVYLSTARWEGMPLAVLEAMSLGIPVVASDVVGNRDAVEELVTGYLYPLGDVKVAACLVEDAAKLDRELIRKHHKQYFSSERMVAETLAVYRDVLNGSR